MEKSKTLAEKFLEKIKQDSYLEYAYFFEDKPESLVGSHGINSISYGWNYVKLCFTDNSYVQRQWELSSGVDGNQ